MAAVYKQFLAAPSSSLLADKASLHYVTTLSSFVGATDIIKHLNSLQKQVKKKKEEVINLVDGQNIIVVEVDTALEFITSGGVYLPGLDDNFLSDRVAHLPIMHIVTFNADGKISQIRQQWDQASLLKQLEVIGKSGRNWPIKDGREQLTLIQACLKSSGHVPIVQSQNHNDVVIRTRGNSTNVMRDPHASLHLFGSREEIESAEPPSVVSPYAGQKPKQRTFTDILGDEPLHGDPDAHRRSMSPSKAGQGKNLQPIRIFEGQEHDEDEDEEPQPRPKEYIRAHPAKYQHFDFSDGSDAKDAPKSSAPAASRPKTKHDSQWSFDDFTTPVRPKPSRTLRKDPDDRHWDTEYGTAETNQAPVGKGPIGKARRDAESHFEMQDDGELPLEQRRIATRQKGVVHNEGLTLYKDNVFSREEEEEDPSNRALGNITNLKDRGKDFDPHFTMTDDSPAPAQLPPQVTENRMKAVKMMNSNWTLADESPVSQKENRVQNSKAQPDQRIHIAGDGMGGKKGAARDFLYGGDETAEPHKQLISRKATHGTQKSNYWDL